MKYRGGFRITETLQEQLRKFLVFIVEVLLTAKSETGFQSFILAIHYWKINPDQNARLRCFKRIGGMQSAQKYSGISTWPQDNPRICRNLKKTVSLKIF